MTKWLVIPFAGTVQVAPVAILGPNCRAFERAGLHCEFRWAEYGSEWRSVAVAAKAGTHNLRRQNEKTANHPGDRNRLRYIWVPAFAGTITYVSTSPVVAPLAVESLRPWGSARYDSEPISNNRDAVRANSIASKPSLAWYSA
jgi:hypothetical protein